MVRGLRRRRFFKDLYGNRVLFHLLDQSDIRNVTNKTGELCAVIAYDAGSIDDHVIDLLFVRTVNQPKVDRLVDLPSIHLSFDYSKDVLPKLPQEDHLFVGKFGDAAHKCVLKEVHKKVDELVLVPMGKRGPGGSQCRFAISS